MAQKEQIVPKDTKIYVDTFLFLVTKKLLITPSMEPVNIVGMAHTHVGLPSLQKLKHYQKLKAGDGRLYTNNGIKNFR